MSAAGTLNYGYLAYLSKPAHERCLYRAICKGRLKTIVEVGIGDGLRSARMICVAGRYASSGSVRYTGIDLFESRPQDNPGMTLRQTHRLLGGSDASVQLLPGDPYWALSRTANALVGTDLLVISADLPSDALRRAWFYAPRMLHGQSQVFVEELDPSSPSRQLRRLGRAAIDQLAARVAPRTRRAA